MNYIDENVVLDFYLEEMKKGNVHFLNNRGNYLPRMEDKIVALKNVESNHDRIVVAKEIWKLLFESAMSYIDPDKRGYDKLFAYFDEYVNFEELIFASDSFYRDHTLHCLWVYFLGEYVFRKKEFSHISKKMNDSAMKVNQLISQIENNGLADTLEDFYINCKQMEAQPKKQEAVRCISAIIHDLGYPLKKISKINKSISSILPYFSITNSQEYNFNYSSLQQKYITEFIDMLSKGITLSFSFEDIHLPEKYKENTERITKCFIPDEDGFLFSKKDVENLTPEDHKLLRQNMSSKTELRISLNDKLRYSNEFEEYNHGIMSAFLVHKTIKAYNNDSYSLTGNLIECKTQDNYSFKRDILKASIDHSSDSYRIKTLEDPSAFLTFIDELEEFSRITRADQNRQFINEFCKTNLFWENNYLNVEFHFDNTDIPNLNPEFAFKGKCKRMIHLIDIENFDPEMNIRFTFIGDLPYNKNRYELELGRKLVVIKLNGEMLNIPEYLNSSQFYTTEEYAGSYGRD